MRQERRGPLKRMKRQIGLLTAAACLLAALAGCSAEGTAAIRPAEKTLGGSVAHYRRTSLRARWRKMPPMS